MCHRIMAAIVVATLLWTSMPAGAIGFTDTFDTIDPAWVTDRYEPDAFVSEFFDGDNRLRIGITTTGSAANRPSGYSSTFYNTQGRQRAAAMTPNWIVSARLYVSEDLISGNNLRRTDLWARTGDSNEANARYPIFGIRRFDPADPFNPAAPNINSVWRVYDHNTTNGWVELANAITPGWNLLAIKGGATSWTYELNGNPVYTDTTINTAYPDLTAAFLQAYNFGDSDYGVHWDDLEVIPEPAALSLLGLAGLGLLGRRGRARD